MTDPRWQKAMERLGLYKAPEEPWDDSVTEGCPDPNDPDTYPLVVEAIAAKDLRLYGRLAAAYAVSIVNNTDGFIGNAQTLYEIVMQEFGT